MAPYYACAKCNTVMRCEKNEVYVIEMADFGPYKIWFADLWICPGCGNEVIAGFAVEPLAEHYEDHFQKWLARAEASDYCYRVH